MISAKIIQDSIYNSKRIVTFELEYPRFIHGEFMTHRVFSRNSASSRAIPVEKMLETINNNPAEPIHWGKNQSGMQAKKELEGHQLENVKWAWTWAKQSAIQYSLLMHKNGAHKQISNRITEPFQHMKVVLTSTELDNWFWLRDHGDAQPEIKELAVQMCSAMTNSTPMELKENEWHVPYVSRTRDENNDVQYYTESDGFLSVDDAICVSASCCAQVSYRKSDDSLKKALNIKSILVESEPIHASPIEHQATPIVTNFTYIKDWRVINGENDPRNLETWGTGVTHVDKEERLWSGNFMGWIQYRKIYMESNGYDAIVGGPKI